MAWRYSENEGILNADNNKTFYYGVNRFEIRKLLSYNSSKDRGRFDSEDSYEYIFQSTDWLRLNFNDSQLLSEIELLAGTINVDGVEIEIMGNLRLVLSALEAKGYSFVETELSFTCQQLNIDLGDGGKNGGLEDTIYWFYCAKDIRL